MKLNYTGFHIIISTWKMFFGLLHRCHNPSLGLAIKVKACKVASQEGNLGVKESVRE
jgi:hypothetical protein